MGQAKNIQILLIQRDMHQSDLAKALGCSTGSFYAKMKRDDFRESDLRTIADAMNCDLKISYVPRDDRPGIED